MSRHRLTRSRTVRRNGVDRFVDDFPVLSNRWLPFPSGAAMQVASGVLQGQTLAADGDEMVSNPEFSDDTSGWIANSSATLSRVDSTSDPGASSGGSDAWVIKVVGDGIQKGFARQTLTIILGAQYAASCRAYSPSANTAVNAARLNWYDGDTSIAYADAEDVWQTLSISPTASSTSVSVGLWTDSTAADTTYFDAASIQIKLNGIARPFAANGIYRAALPMPAAAITPRSLVFRMSLSGGDPDALNCWEVRVLPNTAGTDAYLIERNAGAYTTRASADVDWTADATDEIEARLSGSTITVYARKSGESAWTQILQYTSATFNQTAFHHGVLAYDTAVDVCSEFRRVA